MGCRCVFIAILIRGKNRAIRSKCATHIQNEMGFEISNTHLMTEGVT